MFGRPHFCTGSAPFQMDYLRVNDLVLSIEDAIGYSKIVQSPMSFEDRAIHFLLVLSHAGTTGLEVPDEAVSTLVVEWRYALGLEKKERFARYLEDHRLTRAMLSALMRFVELEKALVRNIPYSDVCRHFVENSQSFDRAELLTLSTDDLSLAQEVRELVVEEDEKFQGFAAAFSLDSESARKGGYLGWRRRADLPGAEEAAVFSAHSGELVGPIPIDGGRYRLYQILSIEHPDVKDVEDRIRATLHGQRMAKLRLEAVVERLL